MAAWHSLLQGYDRHRYAWLFYMLLASLCLPPLLQPFGVQGTALEALLAFSLITAVAALGTGRLRQIIMAAALIMVGARAISAWLHQAEAARGSLAVWGLLAALAAASALAYALRGREIGREQIYAALSTYLLAGCCFGLFYWVLEQLAPGSLTVGGAIDAGFSISTAIYYSFVTLASLGYGDVLPVSDAARGLAVVEVVGGQLYLAVMVARLVSAWSAPGR